jgi:hypothetical protein
MIWLSRRVNDIGPFGMDCPPEQGEVFRLERIYSPRGKMSMSFEAGGDQQSEAVSDAWHRVTRVT